MRYLHRQLESPALKAARNFPAVALTGPRRAGKTFLLRRLLPQASYHLFEDPDVVARFRHDPQGFLDGEIVKTQLNAGQRRELYCFRDQQGLARRASDLNISVP